ncbi:cilia- and flagella-associated protein 300-like [Ylistrum balloti]|uniref:cilia- and flagella-associated protein 300-like n=1 Tax=Ylistrum balloti TaxID=509963 RepID=UPI002905B59D|nr:cilia- and flagella-associated protein 300-like [Ylistrum balloti]
MEGKGAKFTFQELKGKKFESIEGKDNKELFMKWSMHGRLKCQMYSFDQPFQAYQKDDFVADFLKDPNVVSSLQTVSESCTWSPVGVSATSVTAEPVPCTVLSMTLFDRLTDKDIVRENGAIRKCFDEFYDDFTISDELRKLLLIDDSDNYCLYSDSEREEFLFRLFKHICLGGKVCQYEDIIDPYLELTKQVYKDLISVQKNSETKELNIISSVFKVTASDDDHMYYPADKPHEQTFSYFVVDPFKRHVAVLYHKFGSSVFD